MTLLRSGSAVPFLLLALILWCLGPIGTLASVDTVITHPQKDGVICEIDASSGEQVCSSESGAVSITAENDTAVEDDPPTPGGDGGVTAEAAAVEDNCVDENENCGFWASIGECEKNPAYMLSQCALSCRSCVKSSTLAETVLYGERQLVNSNENFTKTFQKMHDYMIHTVFVNETFADVRENVRYLWVVFFLFLCCRSLILYLPL